jgi:hypothetical protein
MPASLWTATQYYVNFATGNDANNGLSAGSPFKNIFRAFNIGNATGAPYRVQVEANTYDRASSPSGSGGTVVPTQDCYLFAHGGRVVTGNFDTLTWSGPDATYTNCYTATRSNVGRVFDISTLDSYGDYTELTKVADATTCNSTAGSWALVGTTLYVHRADGAQVTNSNTRAYLSLAVNTMPCGTKNLYVSGFDFEGGKDGVVVATSVATRNLVFDNCSAKYSGASGAPVNGFAFQDTTGIVVCNSCTANANSSDGFNGHWTQGGASGLYMLNISCVGNDNGRFGSTSNNGLTWHDGIIGIDVNGTYSGNYGVNFHVIGASQGWAVGTVSTDSQGDGASIGSIAVMSGNSTMLWLLGVTASSTDASLQAQGTSIIRYRQPVLLDGPLVTTSSGVITTY